MIRRIASVRSVTRWVALGIIIAPSLMGANLFPEGTAVGAVQFDSTIELRSMADDSYVILFARYWVSPEYYQVAVVWAEPHGRGLNFGVYPPTLSIRSDHQRFQVTTDLFAEKNGTYPKPIESRGAFTAMFGDYPIRNIRFAEQEALGTRIYSSELSILHNHSNAIGSQVFDISLTNYPERDVTSLRARTKDARLDRLELLNGEKALLKSVSYEYDAGTNTCRQHVHLPERPIMAGLPGKGIQVVVIGKTNQIKEVPALHHKGGRTSSVEYQTFTLGGKVLALPTRIEVRGGPENGLLRSVQITNVRKTDFSSLQAQDSAARFAGFTSAHKEYRQFLTKYWQKDVNEVTRDDREAIKKLCSHFQNDPAGENTIGEQLRRLNILMELNRIWSDGNKLEDYYCLYLETLGKNGLTDVVLVGGYCGIDTLMLWGRTAQANAFLNRWVKTVSDTVDAESIRRFGARELAKGNFWPIARLLEGASERTNAPPGLRFEIAAMKCVALHEAKNLVNNRAGVKGNIAKAQADWIAASIPTDRIENLLRDALVKAQFDLNNVSEITKEQRNLKDRLAAIAETLARTNTARR